MLDTVPLEPHRRARAERWARWSGLALGALLAQQLVAMDGLGTGFLYAITGFGLCATAGVLVGDALTPRPDGAVRTAELAPRRVRDQVPRRMTAALLLQALALLGLLAAAAALASPDDLGRAGRALTVTCDAVTRTRSPWPGSYYGLPILASLAAATLACTWALRRIAHRPGSPEQRRTRSSAIVAAWGTLVSAPLLGVSATAAAALPGTTCDARLATAAGWLLWPLALLALTTLAWSLHALARR